MKSHLNELFDDYNPKYDQAPCPIPEFTFGCLGSYQNDDNESLNSLDSDFLDEMN